MAIGNGDSAASDIELLVYDPDNPIMVNSCSGMSVAHVHGCDELCPREALDELDIDIINEERLWAKDSMNPAAMTVDTITLNMMVHSLRRLLIKSNFATEEEIDFEFKTFKLENLRVIRMAHRDRVREAQTKRIISTPRKPGLLGPDGRELPRRDG